MAYENTGNHQSGRRAMHWAAIVLVVIGAINWGLVGLFQFDLVAALFGGADATLSRIVYTLVGIAGVVLLVTEAMLHRPLGHGGTLATR
jgi:uncharacterized membrane protein YuzA (DUF378 family)